MLSSHIDVLQQAVDLLKNISSEDFQAKKARFDYCLKKANRMVLDARDHDLTLLEILKA